MDDERLPPLIPASRPAEGTVGEYNGKFMCGQFVLEGRELRDSAGHSRRATATSSIRTSAGSFAGLRLAKDL
jgi:formylglycine-generating enzyme required for sulfatase activity